MTEATPSEDPTYRPAALANGPTYLDYNATTPLDPRVLEAMMPFLDTHFGNPSSAHAYAQHPREALHHAREQVAALIGASPHEIVFMGSGTEADAAAIRGTVTAARRMGITAPHVITQATEHPAVLAACDYVRDHHGAAITVLRVDSGGLVDPDELSAAFRPDTVLVSIMHANNETGVIQPISELARRTRERGALFHTDAAQTLGKVGVDVADLGVDLLTIVGHKLYAPKGIAALYIRDAVPIEPLISGGGQESGRRAGTENIPYAVALGQAAALARADLAAGAPARIQTLRDLLLQRLTQTLPERVHLNGAQDHRLPQTLNISIDATRGQDLLQTCPQLAASTGSACHAGTDHPSPVLTAMGYPRERAMAALRLSLGRWSTAADIDTAAHLITHAATQQR